MSFKWVCDILMFMLFAGESCQSAENKMTLFNFRLLFLDSARTLFKIDDPYVVSKLKTSEPSSAGLQAGPVGSIACYKILTHDSPFSFKMVLDPVYTHFQIKTDGSEIIKQKPE